VVDLSYDHEIEKGVYNCTVRTPEGLRKIVVRLSADEMRADPSFRELKNTSRLSSVAVSAMHFAIDEDERGEPSEDKNNIDISVLDYSVFDENGDIEVFVRRVDSPGQSFPVAHCGQRHDVKTGKPIDHECYIFPVEAIYGLQMGWSSAEKLINTFLKGEKTLVHSVVCMDDTGRTIENVRFRLWFPDGPRSTTTLRIDTALRVCAMVSSHTGNYKSGRKVDFEIVSESMVLKKERSSGVWR
jgi:hypothetical protein